jgi:hypothetical protein
VGCGVTWVRHGWIAVKQHWARNVGLSVALAAILWGALVAAATVKVIYDDHVDIKQVATRQLAIIEGSGNTPGLRQQIARLRDSIDGPGGYVQKLSEARSSLRAAQSQLDTFRAAVGATISEPQRDPDTLYQLGKQVAQFVGAVIDLPRSSISYNTLRFHGDFDLSQQAEYRGWRIRCDSPDLRLPPVPPGMGDAATVAISGGSCRILGTISGN